MPTTDLMDALLIDSVSFIPQWRQEFSRQAGGTPRVADLGPEVWFANIGASTMANDDAVHAAAIIHALRGSLNTFYVYDVRRPYPKADETGSILGASTVLIAAIGAGNDTISLSGLPVGYVISPGDKFCFDYGSSPVHRAFHEFSAGGTANGSGVLAATAVVPHIRVGATVGLTVTLKKAAAEMMILPNTYNFPSNGPTISSISLQAVQIP